MSRGKIYYLGGFELPNKNAAAHRVVANGKILRNLGFEVVFVGVDSERATGELQRCAEDYFGFECWSVPYPRGMRAWLSHVAGSSEVMALLAKGEAKETVGVICYNYPAIAQLRIRLLCRRLGIKHLADATEWYDASAGSLVHRAIKSFDTALRMHWVHVWADGVITTSQFMTDFYTDRNKVVVELPTLFDADKFAPPAPRDTAQFKRFVYVGKPFDAGRVNADRSNLKERLDISIELFHRSHRAGRDFRFDIFGIDQVAYLRVFPEHAEMLDEMAHKVTFHGHQSNDRALACIAQSDFSIFFRDETRVTLAGFPSKAAESISCGTPVISNTMRSLERYRRVPGMFLAEKGGEFAMLEQLSSLSSEAIEALKADAYRSRAFDYRQFESVVAVFLNKVGIQ